MGHKKDTYIFIKGYFDTLDVFSDEIITALEARGKDCFIFHRERMEKDLSDFLVFLLNRHRPKAAIVFNNLGYNMGNDQGGNLWESLQIPYINILMDHPFHYKKALSEMPKTAKVCCIDNNHVDYIHKYYPQIKAVTFLPHGGCAHAIKQNVPSQIPLEERDIDVLYAGNLSRVLIETLIPDFDSIKGVDGISFSKACLEELIARPNRTTEDVICEQLKKEGLNLTPEEEKEYIHAFRFIDGFAVSYYRELAVRCLVENGIKVHVLGLGWETCDFCDHPNLILEGKVDSLEVFPYMKRAKIVLNTLTWFKSGAHDRIFNGMLSKAVALTDASDYLIKQFTNRQELVFFSLDNIGMLPEIVKELLENPTELKKIAEAGYQKAKEFHTWENRIEELL